MQKYKKKWRKAKKYVKKWGRGIKKGNGFI
jgi:hypothetical protein